jgi:hypothetical protein
MHKAYAVPRTALSHVHVRSQPKVTRIVTLVDTIGSRNYSLRVD